MAKTKVDTVQCKLCSEVYHKTCVSNNKRLLNSETCDNCAKPSPSPISPADSIKNLQESSKLSSAEAVLEEINGKLSVMHQMKKQLEEMHVTIDFYAEKYQTLFEFQTETIERLKKSENKMADLIHKNSYLEKCNQALEQRVSTLENEKLEKNIEIVGVEAKENENLMKVVQKIAETLHLKTENIEHVYRVGKQTPGGKPRPIVARLRRREDRDEWLRARKQRRRLNNGDIYENNSDRPVYINENISKQVRDLFWLCKDKLKSHFRFIWIQNGRVLAKRDDESKKTHHICCENDIKQLIQP